MRKWLGHHQGTCRNGPDWEEARSMEECKWRLEPEGVKRRCERSLSCRDAVESTNVDLDGKSRRKTGRRKIFQKTKRSSEEIKSLKEESDSSGIRRNVGLRKGVKECGAGRSGREDFRTERDQRSPNSLFRCDNQCSERPSATGSFARCASTIL